ncbi:MAG: hypothetical protein ACFFAO_05570 [Candidatus Hermodarchaeota archaeon]
MFNQKTEIVEDLVRKEKQTIKLVIVAFIGLIISSFLLIILTDIYHLLMDSYLQISIEHNYECKILIEFFWMMTFVLIFFFTNLMIWLIISYIYIRKSLIKINRIKNSNKNIIFCNVCGQKLSNEKNNREIKPVKKFSANGYHCKHCYKKAYLISIITILLIPVIYMIIYYIIYFYIFYINIRNQTNNYYMVPFSFYYLEWVTLPLTFFILIFSIIYYIIGIVRFTEIYKKNNILNTKLKFKKRLLKWIKLDDKLKIKTILIFILLIGALIFPFIYHDLYKRENFYYNIEYDINSPYEDKIIEKVESFDYPSYLTNFIDEDIIEKYKNDIQEKYQFNWDIGRYRHLIYYVSAELDNNINLSYGYSYIKIIDDNGKIIGSTFRHYEWYINYNLLPQGSNDINVGLTEITFVKMYMFFKYGSKHPSYGFKPGGELEIEQYIFLDKNFEVLLVFIKEVHEGKIN